MIYEDGYTEEIVGPYATVGKRLAMTDDRAFEIHRANQIREMQARMRFQQNTQRPPAEESVWEWLFG